jgi:hypothetical protein
VVLMQPFNNLGKATAERIGLVGYPAHSTKSEACHDHRWFDASEQGTGIKALFAATDVRALIANRPGVRVQM